MPEQHEKDASRQQFDGEIGVRGIVFFGVGLAIILVLTGIAMWGLFRSLQEREAARESPPSPLVLREGAPPVPAPHLQTTPEQDLRALRVLEDSLLHSYGWVDERAQVARIPVARAMELLLQQGLPVRLSPRPWDHPGAWSDPSLQRLKREESQ